MHDDDADIDYINERNMKFNQKLERFYGKYTKDIKDNLERGTAVQYKYSAMYLKIRPPEEDLIIFCDATLFDIIL